MSPIYNRPPIQPLLRRIPLFGPLSDPQIRNLSELFVISRVEAGQVILMQGEPVGNFIVICSGSLTLLRGSAEGRERVVDTLKSGAHFGLAEMITGEGSVVTIRAAEICELGVLRQSAFKREVLAHPGLCYALMQTMARSIFHLVGELERATFENVPQRLARYLLTLASASGVRTAKGVQVVSAPTHQDMANLIGASRETVTRALGKLQDEGLIETGYRRLVVLDREGLELRTAE